MNLAMLTLNSSVHPELVEGPLCSHYPETIHPELVEGPLCSHYPETVYPELVEGPLCSRDYIILTVPFDCSLRLLPSTASRSGRTVTDGDQR